MRHRRPQIWVCRCACRIARRIIRAVASERIVRVPERTIAGCGATVSSQPCVFNVVEDIESFGAKFESHALLDREVLEDRHIKVRAPRVGEIVSWRVPECQAAGCSKCRRIVGKRAKAIDGKIHHARSRIADQIGIRLGRVDADPIRNASIVPRHSIGHAERCAGLNRRDARPLPSAENLVGQSGTLEERLTRRADERFY